MFLAGPALVKAAIGQDVDAETLGGATTHSALSGTADYHEKNDYTALDRIKGIIDNINIDKKLLYEINKSNDPDYKFSDLIKNLDFSNLNNYDMLEVFCRITDRSQFIEYKAEYGKTKANQKKVIKNAEGKIQLGGVIYNDSADKAARVIMNCNQDKIPILFIHDVNGFMVGKDSEISGIA